MKIKMMLIAVVLGTAGLQGCATMDGDGQVAETRGGVCDARARVGTRIRNCSPAPVTTADRSIMEQQINRCTGLGCEGGD